MSDQTIKLSVVFSDLPQKAAIDGNEHFIIYDQGKNKYVLASDLLDTTKERITELENNAITKQLGKFSTFADGHAAAAEQAVNAVKYPILAYSVVSTSMVVVQIKLSDTKVYQFLRSNGDEQFYRSVAIDGTSVTASDWVKYLRYEQEDAQTLKATTEQAATNKANISTNAANIASNAKNIATNTANIGTNKAAIEANTKKLVAHSEELDNHGKLIAANTESIKANADTIAEHTTKLEEQGKLIDTNTSGIATNKTAIEANATAIKSNADNITQNTEDIATNAESIKTNAEGIKANKEATETNATAIAELTEKVDEGRPTSLEVEAPEKITLGNLVKQSVQAKLLPENCEQNIIFIVDGQSVSVDPDGTINVKQSGISRIHVIPTQKTQLFKTIVLNVESPQMRLIGTNMRFTSANTIRLS